MSVELERGTLSIELVVRGRRALVVGGCRECASKVTRLLASNAIVKVVAEGDVEASIAEQATRGELVLERRGFVDSDLEGVIVTFVSPELEELGARLAADAGKSGRLVSTLDRPDASTFVNPAVVDSGGIKLALSSGGAAPGLLRRIREDLQTAFDDPLLRELVQALRRTRAELPRGQRQERLAALIEGFAVKVSFELPEWLRRKSLEKGSK